MSNYLYIIDQGLYVSGNVPNEFFTSAQYKPADKDLFRLRTGKFYNGEVSYPQNTDYKLYDLGDFDPNATPHPTFEFAASTDSSLFAGSATDLTTQNFKNSLNPDYATDGNPRNIIGTFPLEQEFTDHVTQYELPSKEENSTRVASIDLNYNFYQKAYEFATTQLPVSESLLPSFYALATELEYGIRLGQVNLNPGIPSLGGVQISPNALPDPNDKTFAHLTLNDYKFPGNPPGNPPKSFNLFELIQPPSVFERPEYFVEEGNYFDEYAAAINNINNAGTQDFQSSYNDGIGSYFKNQILPPEKKIYTDYNDYVKNYPLYTHISFTKDPNNTLAQSIIDQDLMSSLIKQIIDGSLQKSELAFNLSGTVPFAPLDNSYLGFNTPERLNAWNIADWPDPSTEPNANYLDYVLFGNANTTDYDLASDPFSDLAPLYQRQKTLLSSDLGGYYNNPQNRRTLEQIFKDGIKIKDPETIFYKIEKWSVTALNNPDTLIQSFYLPNIGDLTEHNFYDTQIKYGRKYIYRVYAYTALLGTKYMYSLKDDPDPTSSTFTVSSEPKVCVEAGNSIQLVAIPYYQELITVADKPPVSPDIDIVPYYGVKNKLLFLLRGNVGNTVMQPISILDEDRQKFDAIRAAFKVPPNGPINFFSDDSVTTFEVFRLEEKPNSYRDFAKGKYTQITAGEFQTPCKTASAASLVDMIEPNKKYYYTFRSIDIHQNISNPSIVYELEISFDGATPFLVQNIIDFEPEKNPPQMPSRKFKKYLRIRPAFTQTRLNEVKTFENTTIETLANSSQGITLGTTDESLWGKTFKIRIVSRKTGRKIDLNVTFNQEQKQFQTSIENKLC